MIDCVPAARFQPEIVPSSVANRKVAGLPSLSMKALSAWNALNTCPVGVAGPPPGVGGAIVTGGIAFTVTAPPLTAYMLANPELLSEIQIGLVGLDDMPHGLIRFGSV